MLERYDKPLRIVCGVLAAILAAELAKVVIRRDPLARLEIPEVPALAPNSSNAPAGPGGKPAAVENIGKKPGTNLAAAGATNNTTGGMTNAAGTNTMAAGATNAAGTNAVPAKKTGPPDAGPMVGGVPMPGHPPRMGPGMPGMPGGGPPLPPLAQARIDRIVQSELLAPVPHPLPMALLGIAGPDVFLRTATGQTGIIKEGAELGGVKLLRIGMNRVLVEENGEKKELTIFSGFGSESLLPKQNENSK